MKSSPCGIQRRNGALVEVVVLALLFLLGVVPFAHTRGIRNFQVLGETPIAGPNYAAPDISTSGSHYGVTTLKVQSGFAYLAGADDQRVKVYNVQNPASPTWACDLVVTSDNADSQDVEDVFVFGRYVYVAIADRGSGGLPPRSVVIFDTGDPANPCLAPAQVGALTPCLPTDPCVPGIPPGPCDSGADAVLVYPISGVPFLFVADGEQTNAVYIYALGGDPGITPATPRLVATWRPTSPPSPCVACVPAAVSVGTLDTQVLMLVGAGGDGVYVVDVSGVTITPGCPPPSLAHFGYDWVSGDIDGDGVPGDRCDADGDGDFGDGADIPTGRRQAAATQEVVLLDLGGVLHIATTDFRRCGAHFILWSLDDPNTGALARCPDSSPCIPDCPPCDATCPACDPACAPQGCVPTCPGTCDTNCGNCPGDCRLRSCDLACYRGACPYSQHWVNTTLPLGAAAMFQMPARPPAQPIAQPFVLTAFTEEGLEAIDLSLPSRPSGIGWYDSLTSDVDDVVRNTDSCAVNGLASCGFTSQGLCGGVPNRGLWGGFGVFVDPTTCRTYLTSRGSPDNNGGPDGPIAPPPDPPCPTDPHKSVGKLSVLRYTGGPDGNHALKIAKWIAPLPPYSPTGDLMATWGVPPFATSYNLYRGTIDSIIGGGYDHDTFSNGIDSCGLTLPGLLINNEFETDPAQPRQPNYYYLVTSCDSCGHPEGDYGWTLGFPNPPPTCPDGVCPRPLAANPCGCP